MLAGSAFRIPLCAALCALACPVLARDQPTPQPSVERRAVPAERMNDGERITLDGIFDEPVWKRARPADDFIQVDPSNGRPATEPTEVRIAFSDDVFYMAVTCFDFSHSNSRRSSERSNCSSSKPENSVSMVSTTTRLAPIESMA